MALVCGVLASTAIGVRADLHIQLITISATLFFGSVFVLANTISKSAEAAAKASRVGRRRTEVSARASTKASRGARKRR